MLKLKPINQDGLVSITVTMIIMAIMTLIVIGFTVIARREQRAALDRQLSTQAFYAAESGVNDAIRYGSAISSCQSPVPIPGASPGSNELDNNISYTCVLINNRPDELKYGAVDTKTSTILPVKSATGSMIQSIKISWEATVDPDLPGMFQTGGDFDLPPANGPGGWGGATGILRTSVIRTESLTRTDLVQNQGTFFLYPKEGSESNEQDWQSGADQGKFVPGGCSSSSSEPRNCNAIINLPGAGSPGGGLQSFYLRLKAIYHPVAVTITAYTEDDAGGTIIPLEGTQMVIDVTGKAADVLRRIEVRVPVKPNGIYPEFAVESVDSICKHFTTRPGVSTFDSSGLPPSGRYDTCQIPTP